LEKVMCCLVWFALTPALVAVWLAGLGFGPGLARLWFGFDIGLTLVSGWY